MYKKIKNTHNQSLHLTKTACGFGQVSSIVRSNKKMKERTTIIFYVLINLLFVLTTLWSLMIYTSLMSEKLPWYEPCGMQFLAILIFSCPIFLIIGIIQLIFGKFIAISKWVKLSPFIGCAGMGLPIFIDDGLGIIMQIFGTLIGIVTISITITFVVFDLLKMKRINF